MPDLASLAPCSLPDCDSQMLQDWVLLYKFVPLYLPAYSPDFNSIEMECKQAKYHWRSFKTWAKERLLEEVKELLDGYGRKFHVHFN